MQNVKSEGCCSACDCGKPSGNKKAKIIICLIVLLAVSAIFVYKANSAQQTAKDNTKTAFAAPISNQALEPAVKSVGDKKNIGELLDSLASLNKLAINQDAVFIFVPASDKEIVKKETIDAIASAEKTLKSSNIKIGLYTLRFSQSKEYASIATQLTLPAVLVISKGKGTGSVTGKITETKLIQTYLASSRSGGCCPSGGSTAGCDPSAPVPCPTK
jgi:uncharacterized protein YpmB